MGQLVNEESEYKTGRSTGSVASPLHMQLVTR